VSFLATHLPAYLVKRILIWKKKGGIIIDRNMFISFCMIYSKIMALILH
jgi:hypothetical protein